MTVLEPSPNIFCIDCTHYDVGDNVGKFLALACQSSYLSFFVLIAATYGHRTLENLGMFAGAVLSAGLGKLLKAIWRQPRPSAKCALLGVCDTYGMPSSHTQAVAYCLAAYIVSHLWLYGHHRSHLQRMLTTTEACGLAVLMAMVAYARVYLGYHSPFQVMMGAFTGLAFGWLWTWGCLIAIRRYGEEVEKQLPFLGELGFRAEGRIFRRKLGPEIIHMPKKQ